MNHNYYAILLAGGIGSRFWPVSTTDFPKQFQDLLGTGETLLQRTFNRLVKIIPAENILVLTNERYRNIVADQLRSITNEQILAEPAMRNTAPCILYASLKIQKMNSDALMIVAPSDHWIENEVSFASDIEQCFDYCANSDAMLTLGIKPLSPNTGYGYIEFAEDFAPIKHVLQFTEKPDLKTAESFIESGKFLWNGGIFIWSANTIVEAFKQFQPKMAELFLEGWELYNTAAETPFIQRIYPDAENISIDYAVLEKADNVYVLPAAFDWNDLGTWGSLHDKLAKDANENAVVNADVILENAANNIIRSDSGKLIIIDGLDDYIIVDRDDVLLIYPKSKEQEIKRITALATDKIRKK